MFVSIDIEESSALAVRDEHRIGGIEHARPGIASRQAGERSLKRYSRLRRALPVRRLEVGLDCLYRDHRTPPPTCSTYDIVARHRND